MVGDWRQQNGLPYRRRWRPILIAAFIALCLAVGVTACILSRHAGPRPGIPQAVGVKPTAKLRPDVPTKSRPIIIKNWDLVFGGHDGTKRDKIKWPGRPQALAVSPNGRIGAALVSTGKGVRLRMYDPARKLIQDVGILHSRSARTVEISITNDRTAVVLARGRILDALRDLQSPPPHIPRPPRPVRPITETPVIAVDPEGEVRKVSVEGEGLKAFALDGGRWIVCSGLPKAGYRIFLFRRQQKQWAVTVAVPKGAEKYGATFWLQRGKEPSVCVQGYGYSRRYDMKGKLVEHKSIWTGRGG